MKEQWSTGPSAVQLWSKEGLVLVHRSWLWWVFPSVHWHCWLGQQFLTTCPGKKSQFSRDANLSRFWLGAPDLSQFAHLCSCMLMHRWPKISSDFICIYEKIASGWEPWTPLGELMMLCQAHKSDPPVARACGAPTLRFAPSVLVPIAVPKLWSPYCWLGNRKYI